jgi:hypothetical protein
MLGIAQVQLLTDDNDQLSDRLANLEADAGSADEGDAKGKVGGGGDKDKGKGKGK